MKRMVMLCMVLVVVLCASAWSASLVPGATKAKPTSKQAPEGPKQPVLPPGVGPNGKPGSGPCIMPPMYRSDPMCVVSALMLPPSGVLLSCGGPLAMTQEQVDKLTPIIGKTEDTIRRLHDKAAGPTRGLREAVMGKTDSQQVQKLLATVQSIETEIANTEIEAWSDIKTILTADQMRKLMDFMQRVPMMGSRGMPGGPLPMRPGPGSPTGADPRTTE